MKHRDQANVKVEQEVAQPDDTFVTQTTYKASNAVVARYRVALLDIQASELKRLYQRLPQLDAHSREAVQQCADCIVETMLRPPLESLRDQSANNHELAQALRRLFQLGD